MKDSDTSPEEFGGKRRQPPPETLCLSKAAGSWLSADKVSMRASTGKTKIGFGLKSGGNIVAVME